MFGNFVITLIRSSKHYLRWKVSEECRQQIFSFHYSLGSYERQRDFICEIINIVKPVRSMGKKSVSHQYHLSVDNKKERVCPDFFQKTL